MMLTVQTIGSNLAMMEQRARQVKKTNNQVKLQSWMNTGITWFAILLIGIMLGYAWHMKQIHNITIVRSEQWINSLHQETFEPIKIINSIKGDL